MIQRLMSDQWPRTSTDPTNLHGIDQGNIHCYSSQVLKFLYIYTNIHVHHSESVDDTLSLHGPPWA